MAIDSQAKRQSITNITARLSMGIPNELVNVGGRANTSFIYFGLDYIGNVIPLENAQVLFPIQQSAVENRIVYKRGDESWTATTKSTNNWRAETCTLRFRVRDDYFKVLYKFCVDFKGQIITLDSCGYWPFIRATTNNDVYLLTFDRPLRLLNEYWEMSITFRAIAITP